MKNNWEFNRFCHTHFLFFGCEIVFKGYSPAAKCCEKCKEHISVNFGIGSNKFIKFLRRYKMNKKTISITIDSHLLEEFKNFCKENGYKVSTRLCLLAIRDMGKNNAY
jgi:hypothetical protein